MQDEPRYWYHKPEWYVTMVFVFLALAMVMYAARTATNPDSDPAPIPTIYHGPLRCYENPAYHMELICENPRTSNVGASR